MVSVALIMYYAFNFFFIYPLLLAIFFIYLFIYFFFFLHIMIACFNSLNLFCFFCYFLLSILDKITTFTRVMCLTGHSSARKFTTAIMLKDMNNMKNISDISQTENKFVYGRKYERFHKLRINVYERSLRWY